MHGNSPRRTNAVLGLALAGALGLAACHREPPPPPDPKGFRLTDKFFDVKSNGPSSFLLVGYRSQFAKSADGGATWEKTVQPTLTSFTRIKFWQGGKKGFGVGHEGIIYSTEDGGENWKPLTSGTKNALFDLDYSSENTVWVVGDISTTVHTTDGGQSWKTGKVQIEASRALGVTEDMSLAITDPIFYGVDFVDDQTGFIGGEFGQIRRTKDGGQTWTSQHGALLAGRFRDIMAMPTWLCIRMKDAMNGIAVGTYGAIVSTEDGGETWRFNVSPVNTPLYDIRWLPDGDALIVGSSGSILRGNPQGGYKRPQMPDSVFTWMSAVDFDQSGNGVIVGAHKLILTSKDFGKNWEWSSNG